MKVTFVHITPEAEKVISYCARVSSENQDNPEYEKLLKYCIKHKHWSVFQMASMCVEIVTSRAIAQQILRHRSFNFQEFSQRYAKSVSTEFYPARKQDLKNRQNSTDDISEEDKEWFEKRQNYIATVAFSAYNEALEKGIAKEQARFLLPLSTTTKLYMHGTIRDWIHYIELREKNGTQKEHADIAKECQKIFREHLPTISKALEWE